MTSQKDILQGFDNASQKHEKEIVIELGGDRILHYTGVYVVLGLGVLSQISNLAGNNISCFPAENNSSLNSNFISYAKTYCWESFDNVSDNGELLFCSKIGKDKLLTDPHLVKIAISYAPYFLFFEALLFALPTAWWHYRVGARLVGHLKFMRTLLNNIYNGITKIPIGNYRAEPYDANSYYLDGLRRYNPKTKLTKRDDEDGKKDNGKTNYAKQTGESFFENFRRRFVNKPREEKVDMEKQKFVPRKNPEGNVDKSEQDKDEKNSGEPMQQKIDGIPGTSANEESNQKHGILMGPILDRHFFSMLCFENFSSLEFHPYIISVFRLTEKEKCKIVKKPVTMLQGILRQLCHPDNFGKRFLVRCYIIKHVIGMILSLVVLFASVFLFIQLGGPFVNSSFECKIINYEDVCVVCTIHRIRDVSVLYILNILIVLLYLSLSIAQYCFIRRSGNRANCFYFEDIDDSCSSALLSVHLLQQEERERSI